MRFPSVPTVEKDRLPPTLLSFIISFNDQMHSKVSYNDASSESCKILIGVKQGCVLAPTLSGIFFSVLLNIPHSITPRRESTCMHTRSDGKLFSLSRLKAKSKFRTVFLKEMLFADDAALISHTE